jgi:hypothetical protein
MKNQTILLHYLLISFSLFILFSCSTAKKTDSVIYYDIIFGDYFSDDTLDFYIDDSLIIKHAKLESAGSSGVTKIHVNIFYDGSNYFINIGSDKRIVDLKKDSNLFKLIINGKERTFKIKRNKGKYLLFFGDKDKLVDFFQSKQPMELD